ncbi:MAG TPA: hypothetical protein VI231_22215 [Candidatus Binatia bacterium]|jgi:Mn-dependent DtxR family transcriptional regulator
MKCPNCGYSPPPQRRRLRARHYRALQLLANRPAGQLVSVQELAAAVGEYATNTLKSLADRGYIELSDVGAVLTDVGRRAIG